MNGRLKIIEQQLLGIDSAAFQNLCDIYLSLREQDISSFNRTGSQLGKQKTTKGTPDTFFRLTDGSLRYVEYTTQADGLVKKIKEDIDKCLDSTITGIPASEVHKIIICFNSRLEVEEETEITQYAVSKNIKITLIDLDWLALEIYSKYLILAKDILGIPLDTGQLLPIQNFIDEYNNKAGKLSTPLDNNFLHRTVELSEIADTLANNDLLIISGAPGVGKTKLALESLSNFLDLNKDYSAFAVSKKDQDISEDLKIYLQNDKNYILLIDDANRQLPNFTQILGIFREKRKGNIKLIITVRDYALNDVEKQCNEYSYKIVNLKKFSDDEITQLISGDAFEIKNPKYQKRIVEIADGNARLAIMASRLAREEQIGFLYGDGERIFELYDFYFKTFIKDFDIFENKIVLKVLGLISFFYSVDRDNKEFIKNVLQTFEIDYYDFNEAIDLLEQRELIEVQYNHARVSEQVMSTYFFYKVFIKDEILPFKTLFYSYFPVWNKRFKDTIIPSNNSFGYDNVLDKINSTLTAYLHSIYSNEEKVLEFFSLFWFYKREELLSYFYERIKNFPEPVNVEYDTKYETNKFAYERNQTLDLISDLFYHITESYIPSLELAFEYCRKNAESLPELVKIIRERLLFDDDDSRNDFERQVELFKLLTLKFKDGEPHYVKAFFALADTFLAHQFQITKGGRNHSITFYQYPLPFNDVIKDFRRSLWNSLFDRYESYPDEIFAIISDFNPGYHGVVIKILEFDLSLLLPFIDAKLDPAVFKNIHFVNELVSWLDRTKLTDQGYRHLKNKFTSKEYDTFKKLDWNSWRGKQDYDFDNYDEFKSLKEQDIRSSFVFKSGQEFNDLHKVIQNALSLNENNKWGVDTSLNIILEENLLKNEELGFLLLKSVLENYPIGFNPAYPAIKIIVQKSSAWSLQLWNLLKEWKHEYKLYWQLAFIDCLPKEYVNSFYKSELLAVIKSIDKYCYLNFDSFEKFLDVKSENNLGTGINIVEEILSIIYEKSENENINVRISFHFFEKYASMLAHNFELLKNSYLQQGKKVDLHFDFQRDGLKALLAINPDFLLEFIDSFYTDRENRHNRDIETKLSFVWDIVNSEELIEKVILKMIESNHYYGISDHPINIFFKNLNEDQKLKAKAVLLNLITKYNNDRDKMNSVFDAIRHSMSDFFEEAFLYYLKLNTNIENFIKIYWRGNGGLYGGDVIIGDIHAKDWQNILTIVEKSNNQLDLIPIKAYIKKNIEYELRSAEEERKRKFIDPDGW